MWSFSFSLMNLPFLQKEEKNWIHVYYIIYVGHTRNLCSCRMTSDNHSFYPLSLSLTLSLLSFISLIYWLEKLLLLSLSSTHYTNSSKIALLGWYRHAAWQRLASGFWAIYLIVLRKRQLKGWVVLCLYINVKFAGDERFTWSYNLHKVWKAWSEFLYF